jgi:hypothetical protein
MNAGLKALSAHMTSQTSFPFLYIAENFLHPSVSFSAYSCASARLAALRRMTAVPRHQMKR